MIAFKTRLERAKKQGRLTTADLATWFERPYPTVRSWLLKGREPWGPNGEDSLRLMAILERAIKNKRGFPVPIRLSPSNRRAYVEARRHDLDGRVPRACAAE
jgi:hypothetical protein